MSRKSIPKNMIMSTILTVSNFLFPLITYGYVSRVLGAAGTGQVAFASSNLSYFVMFAGLGVASHGRRECAKVSDNKDALSRLTHELLGVNAIAVVISYIALILALYLVPKFQQYRVLILVMSIQIFLGPMGVEWFYQGLEEYTYITKRSLLFKCIAVLMTFILVRDAEDVLWYGIITIFTSCASNVCNILQLRKHVYIKYLGNYNLVKHLKPVLILFASSIAITIYANFDVSMLGFISTDQMVGLYNAAFKIETIILSLSTAVTTVLIPRMASYFGAGKLDKVRALSGKTIQIALLLALPLAFYVIVFAENTLSFIGGEEYIGAATTLRVKMLCIIPLTFTNLFGSQLLIPMGKEKRFTQSITVGIFINLVLNVLLIPTWGAVGAALGTLATECWNMLWMGLPVRQYVEKNIKYLHYVIPMVISIVLAYIVGVELRALNVFWQLAITACVYFGIYYVIQYIRKESIVYQYTNAVLKKLRGCIE